LDLLRCYDKKDMAKDYDLWDMGSESLVGKDQYDLRENWTRQIYNWWSFYALSKHKRVLGIAPVK
jgi:hypothetical protein